MIGVKDDHQPVWQQVALDLYLEGFGSDDRRLHSRGDTERQKGSQNSHPRTLAWGTGAPKLAARLAILWIVNQLKVLVYCQARHLLGISLTTRSLS